MWLKLLRAERLEPLLRPTIKNGSFRNAVIHGRQRLELKMYFKRAGLPWVYDDPTPEIDFDSPYN